jgi:hypothetical protein
MSATRFSLRRHFALCGNERERVFASLSSRFAAGRTGWISGYVLHPSGCRQFNSVVRKWGYVEVQESEGPNCGLGED